MRIVYETNHAPAKGRYKNAFIVDASIGADYIYDSQGTWVVVTAVTTVASVIGLAAALALKANLASPAFTGIPTGPTATPNNNSVQLATTAYVDAAVSLVEGSDVDSFNGRTGTVVSVAGDYANIVETYTAAKTFILGSFIDKGNEVYDIRAYTGFKQDLLTLTDGAITSGSRLVNSPSAPFLSSDVDKYLLIYGGGAGGVPLGGYITSFISSSQVQIAPTATATISGAKVNYGTNNSIPLASAVAEAFAAGGGIVQLPAGNIFMCSNMSGYLKHNIWIRGAGRGITNIIMGENIQPISFGTGDGSQSTTTNVAASDLSVDMSNIPGASYGVVMANCADAVLSHVLIKNQINGAKSMFFWGINSNSSSALKARNLTIDSCIFSDSNAGWEGVTLGQGIDVKIINTIFRDKTSQSALLNYGTYAVKVVGCSFRNTGNGLNGHGQTDFIACNFYNSSVTTFSAPATFTDCEWLNAPGSFGGGVNIQANESPVGETGWDSIAGTIYTTPFMKFIGCKFDSTASFAISSSIYTDSQGRYWSPCNNVIVNDCEFANSQQMAVNILADHITIRDSRFANSNQLNGGTTNYNMGLAGGVIKLINNISVDTQATPTVSYDMLLDRQANTVSIWPQTLLYLEDNYFSRGGGFRTFNGGFSTSPTAGTTIFPKNNTGLAFTSFGIHEVGGGARFEQLATPVAPTATPETVITDAVITSGSPTLTSATAAFTIADTGNTVTGSGIPGGTTITYVNATTVTMSANATASRIGDAVTIGRPVGSTTYTYYIVAEDKNGNKTLVSPSGATTTGYAVLTTASHIKINITSVKGAVKYYVLKNNTSTLLAATTARYGLTIIDSGQSTSAFTNPTRNTTADVVIEGRLTLSVGATNGYILTSDASGNASWAPNVGLVNPMTTQGDIIYGGASGAATRLAAGTNAQVLIGGSTPSWSALNLATMVTGTLPIANGGTGQVTATTAFNALSPLTTAGDILYGGASGAGTRLAAGSSTQVLHAGTTPSWGAVVLTTDVSGILPILNGGTGSSTATGTGSVVLATAPTVSGLIDSGSGNERLTVKSTGANNLAGINLTGRISSTDYTWTFDSRGGADTPNSRLALFNNASAEKLTVLTNGNVGLHNTNPVAAFAIGGALQMFDTQPTGSSADAGYTFGTTIPSGLVTEQTGQILTLGINVGQVGTRDTARVGGFFRLDSRSAQQQFAVVGVPTGGSVERDRIYVNLQDGSTYLNPQAGNLGIGIAVAGTLTDKINIGDGFNIGVGTTTGTKIGTATSQKLGFFNATPIVQPVATVDLGTVLSNLGLRAAGTAYPLTTTAAVSFGSTTVAASTTALPSLIIPAGTAPTSPAEGHIWNDTTLHHIYARLNGVTTQLDNQNPSAPVEVTGTTQAAAVNTKYIANNAGLVTITLPATAAQGDQILIRGKGAGGWKLAQNSGQTIHGASNSTTGVTGFVSSQAQYDCVTVECITANTDFIIINKQGTLTIS